MDGHPETGGDGRPLLHFDQRSHPPSSAITPKAGPGAGAGSDVESACPSADLQSSPRTRQADIGNRLCEYNVQLRHWRATKLVKFRKWRCALNFIFVVIRP